MTTPAELEYYLKTNPPSITSMTEIENIIFYFYFPRFILTLFISCVKIIDKKKDKKYPEKHMEEIVD